MLMRKRLTGKELRKKRLRRKIRGTKARPRLSVFRSHKHIFAQIIDDEKGVTLAATSEKELTKVKSQKSKVKTTTQNSKTKSLMTKTKMAMMVGELLGKKALKAKINKVVFDRGPYQYHGRVKALADGARQAGLEF